MYLYNIKTCTPMKKINLLIKSFILVLLTPIEISKGQRRRNFLKAKKLFKSALF